MQKPAPTHPRLVAILTQQILPDPPTMEPKVQLKLRARLVPQHHQEQKGLPLRMEQVEQPTLYLNQMAQLAKEKHEK